MKLIYREPRREQGGRIVKANTRKNLPLAGYGQMYRSGITMWEKWSIDKRIEQDRKEFERNRISSSLMGKNT